MRRVRLSAFLKAVRLPCRGASQRTALRTAPPRPAASAAAAASEPRARPAGEAVELARKRRGSETELQLKYSKGIGGGRGVVRFTTCRAEPNRTRAKSENFEALCTFGGSGVRVGWGERGDRQARGVLPGDSSTPLSSSRAVTGVTAAARRGVRYTVQSRANTIEYS